MVYNRLLSAAVDYHNRKLLPEAIALYRFLVTEAPPQPTVFGRFAAALRAQGAVDEAIQVLTRLTALQPQSAPAFDQLGQALQEAGRDEAAMAAYAHALDLHPGFVPAFGHYAQLAAAKGFSWLGDIKGRLLRGPDALTKINIEVTTACNLRCQQCPRTFLLNQGQWDSRHMAMEVFKGVLDHLPPAPTLYLSGLGEPTLHPRFGDMVQMARQSGKYGKITTTTNALARDGEYYKELRDAGLDHLFVSVDSFSEEIAKQCRSGTDVALLRRRFSELVQIFPNLTAITVLSPLTLADLPNTLASLAALGVRQIDIHPVIAHLDAAVRELTADEMARALVQVDTAAAKWPHLTVFRTKLLPRRDPSARCLAPFLTTQISVEGFRTPCCCIPGPPELLGRTSVIDQSYSATWQAPGLQPWFDAYFTAEPPNCHNCPLHSGQRSDEPAGQFPLTGVVLAEELSRDDG
jgi:MoaA/NifB/PqqE/SkfB family radical SAM enzyme